VSKKQRTCNPLGTTPAGGPESLLQPDSRHNPTWELVIIQWYMCDVFDEMKPSEGRTEPADGRDRPSRWRHTQVRLWYHNGQNQDKEYLGDKTGRDMWLLYVVEVVVLLSSMSTLVPLDQDTVTTTRLRR
jgi:hypothetical protein